MSALARWFKYNGLPVSGYDLTPTSLTAQLVSEGISIHFEDDIDLIDESIMKDKLNTLVVYTPAIPIDNKEFNYFKNENYPLKKRSEVLGMITENLFTVAVAGTHGKTTTSSMIAHILKSADRDCAAFLGGIATNYNTNLLINENYDPDTIIVVEADEFDRSFLTLHPDIAIVTSADADHLDIYGDKDSLKDSFKAFINKTSFTGDLFINEKIATELTKDLQTGAKLTTYSLERGNFVANNIKIENGAFTFYVHHRDKRYGKFELNMPGYHNVENATVAIAVALSIGVSESEIRSAIESYLGVKRRFEYIVKSEERVFVDDYAHHPAEIEAFLKSMRSLYPNRRITAIFQPHLFTRTRDFASEFAQSLSLADEVILLDIYPAREKPIDGVTSKTIFDLLEGVDAQMCNKTNLIDLLKSKEYDVLATMGAGDIDTLVQPIKTMIEG